MCLIHYLNLAQIFTWPPLGLVLQLQFLNSMQRWTEIIPINKTKGFLSSTRDVCCLSASTLLFRAVNHWRQNRSLFLQFLWLIIPVLWETSMALIREVYAEDTERIRSRREKMKDRKVKVSLDVWWIGKLWFFQHCDKLFLQQKFSFCPAVFFIMDLRKAYNF